MGSYLTVLSFLKNPHTTLPAGITRKFIANMLLPKSRQIHPNVDWSFSAPSLTQVCIFCWISCPPTKCALSKLVFQTHLFHDVHPVQLSQNWKAPSSGSLVPKTQKSHHPCYSTGHTAVGSSESFHVVPYNAVETSSPSVSSSHHSAKGKMELEISSFCGVFFMIFVASKWQKMFECNVDFPLKSIRCPKGSRVA